MLILIILLLLPKTKKLYIPVVICQQKTMKSYRNFLAKDLKDGLIGMNLKQNVKIKMQQTNTDILSNQILLVLIDYLLLNQDAKSKRFTKLEDLIWKNA